MIVSSYDIWLEPTTTVHGFKSFGWNIQGRCPLYQILIYETCEYFWVFLIAMCYLCRNFQLKCSQYLVEKIKLMVRGDVFILHKFDKQAHKLGSACAQIMLICNTNHLLFNWQHAVSKRYDSQIIYNCWIIYLDFGSEFHYYVLRLPCVLSNI